MEIEKSIAELQKMELPDTMELFVDTSFVKQLPAILNNLDELKAWLREMTKEDLTLVITEENEGEAKARCALLNKVAQQIETKRREVKIAYTRPLTVFEEKCKEVANVVLTAKNSLWGQITAADEKRKQNKQEKLREYYEATAGETANYRTFEQIFDKRWLNKGVKYDAAKEAIDARLKDIQDELAAIKEVGGDSEAAMLVNYKRGASLSEVLYLKRQLDMEKQRAAEQAERAAQAARMAEQQAQEAAADDDVEPDAGEADAGADEPEAEQTIVVVFKVETTREKLQELGVFMRENGIKYGRA